jgi:hypothetical protein
MPLLVSVSRCKIHQSDTSIISLPNVQTSRTYPPQNPSSSRLLFSNPPSSVQAQSAASNQIQTMIRTPSPSSTTLTNNSAASTTPTSPPPEPTYTFHWICPRPSCHTCPTPHLQSSSRLPEDYFNTYDDMQQLANEWDMEEIGVIPLEDCNRGCRARQVYTSDEVKVRSEVTGREE